jgi:hypothetical protein
MKLFPLFILLAAVVAAALLPLRAPIASAQLEATPILGEPVVVAPLVTSAAPPPSLPVDDGVLPAETVSTTATNTSAASSEPDACEPNDVPARACALPLDAVSGPFTIVPESDQDFFALDLPQEPSIQTVITVRATDGLDLALSARQENRLVASGAYSLTLNPDVAGPVVLRVENRDPRSTAGEQYRIEVRREIVPPIQAEGETADALAPDVLENNWSVDTATPIAVGVVYNLTFACPDPRPNACPGGDHDYLLVPVKSGVRYLVATFDLDLGVDTVVELFWGSTTTTAAANDDYAPGGPLSALSWRAPTDGLLVVRVAPRNGGLAQNLAEAENGYRFAVAPEASELARKLLATIRQQANVPTPTPTLTAAPSSAGAPATGGGDNAGVSAAAQESIAAGPALIVTETVLRREPRDGATALATLAPETSVTVRGPVSGLWVSVESEASILPGWVRWSDLRRVPEDTAGGEDAQTSAAATSTSQQPGAAVQVTTSPAPAVVGTAVNPRPTDSAVTVRALDPALPPPPPAPIARVPFTLSVVVAATDHSTSAGSVLGIATPTPNLAQPVAQVRVQLVNVFGDLLAEGLTNAQGEARLRRDVRPGDALLVRVPAWGVELPLAADQTRLIITIPEAKR